MIGKQIKHVISVSGVPVKEIAEKLGITPQTIYKMYKKESVDSKYLEDIADILKIPVSTFYPGDSFRGEDYDNMVFRKHSPGFSYYEDIYKRIDEANTKGASKLLIDRLEFVKDEVNRTIVLELWLGSIHDVEVLIFGKSKESVSKLISEYFRHRMIPKIRKETFQEIIDKELIPNKEIANYLKNYTE